MLHSKSLQITPILTAKLLKEVKKEEVKVFFWDGFYEISGF
jgi:hypothetical protein